MLEATDDLAGSRTTLVSVPEDEEPAAAPKAAPKAKGKAKSKAKAKARGAVQPPTPTSPKRPGGGAAPKKKSAAGGVSAARSRIKRQFKEKIGDGPKALIENACANRKELVKRPPPPIGKGHLNMKDADGVKPLHLAVLQRHGEVVETLLAAKADAKAMNAERVTVSMSAAALRQEDVHHHLIEASVDVSATNNEGQRAVDAANAAGAKSGDTFARRIAQLKAHLVTYKGEFPSKHATDDDTRSLGIWVTNVRAAIAGTSGKAIAANEREALEALPGWENLGAFRPGRFDGPAEPEGGNGLARADPFP